MLKEDLCTLLPDSGYITQNSNTKAQLPEQSAPRKKRMAQILCNRAWAHRYVPGTPESTAKLPPDCEFIYLNISPREHRWKACLKHPKLKEMGLRCSHSRCYNSLHSLSEYLRILRIGHKERIHFLSEDKEDGLRGPKKPQTSHFFKRRFYSPQQILISV